MLCDQEQRQYTRQPSQVLLNAFKCHITIYFGMTAQVVLLSYLMTIPHQHKVMVTFNETINLLISNYLLCCFQFQNTSLKNWLL